MTTAQTYPLKISQKPTQVVVEEIPETKQSWFRKVFAHLKNLNTAVHVASNRHLDGER